MQRVLLNSGGMDSFFVAREVPNLLHVFVDIGHKYAAKEYNSAQLIAAYFGAPLERMQGANIGEFETPSGIIPFRNTELLLCAAQHGEELYMGVLKGEINSDKSPEFFDAVVAVMDISHRKQYWSAHDRKHRVVTPLANRTKTQLVRELWLDVGGDVDDHQWQAMLDTVSCYDGEDGHCGRCPSCFKRWVALTSATGLDHGHQFERHPAEWYPLRYWHDKGYGGERYKDIHDAYVIAGRA